MESDIHVSTPLVTVIIPTYNWSSVLRYAIQSVLWQTLTDFELLVMGDGCTDDSGEVVASFHDPRVQWHNLPQNYGNQFAANNLALKMARGKYIAYLGHDDLWYPTHLQLLVDLSERTGCMLAFSALEAFGESGTGARTIWNYVPTAEFQGTPLTLCVVMHRRDVVAQIGYWRDYRELDDTPDHDYFERIWEQWHSIAFTNKLTAFKFVASARKDSYITKRSDDQAMYAERIQNEPDFIQNELYALIATFLLGKNSIAFQEKPRHARLGWDVEYYRKVRGLPYDKTIYKAPGMLFRVRHLAIRILNHFAYVLRD